MLMSRLCGFTPRPTEQAPCGSKSTRRTLRPYSASAAPRLMVVVVLPTPPFWFARAMIRAGPCRWVGIGSGIGRRIVYAVGSAGPRSAPRSIEVCCSRRAEVQASARSPLPAKSVAPSRPRAPADARLYATDSARPGSTLRRVAPTPAQLSTSARVCGRVRLAKTVDGDQRVYLRGGHRGVAEQFLDDAHVGAAVEQVCRVRVPQGVRRDRVRAVHRQPGHRGRLPQDRPGALPGQRTAAGVEE